KQIEHAFAAKRLHEIFKPHGRLAKEDLSLLLLKLKKPALDRADRSFRNVAVLSCELTRILRHIDQQLLQVFEIEKEEPLFVGDLESKRQNAFLRLIQFQYPRQHQRTHVGDRRAQLQALLAENSPKRHGRPFELHVFRAEQLDSHKDLRMSAPPVSHAGNV